MLLVWGCVAIWPMTVPTLGASHWEVAILALPVEHSLNPGKKAHKEEVVMVGKSNLEASTSCTMQRVNNTLSMMQDSCMCLLNSDRLLPSLLRSKMKIKQKTKKILC